MKPTMDLVAGPQGSGKSTFFPVAKRGFDGFNIDDRRRELNKGQTRDFPPSVQEKATQDYEAFIEGHLADGKSFSIEVTLAKEITFTQARRARQKGFLVRLTYVAAELEECTRRVECRLELGRHGVGPEVIRETYESSMRNLPRACREFDVVQVYDNSRRATPANAEECVPLLVLETQHGRVTHYETGAPGWLKAALKASEFDRWS